MEMASLEMVLEVVVLKCLQPLHQTPLLQHPSLELQPLQTTKQTMAFYDVSFGPCKICPFRCLSLMLNTTFFLFIGAKFTILTFLS